MYHFDYDVSLRITHPEMEADVICDKLGLKTGYKWTAGEQRKTPDGIILEGIRESSYCTFRLEHSEDIGLTDFLKECNRRLRPYRDFLRQIRLTGGTSEYFIGWYSDTNSGDVFDLELLKELVGLNIELSLDFYGGTDQKRREV